MKEVEEIKHLVLLDFCLTWLEEKRKEKREKGEEWKGKSRCIQTHWRGGGDGYLLVDVKSRYTNKAT